MRPGGYAARRLQTEGTECIDALNSPTANIDLSSDVEFSAASSIDPDAFVVVTPRLAEHAVVVAQLTSDLNAEARVRRAAMARVVHRLARDQLRIDTRRAVARSGQREIGAAAVIHPHAFVVVAPRLPFDASRFAQLMHELHAVMRVSDAEIASAA